MDDLCPICGSSLNRGDTIYCGPCSAKITKVAGMSLPVGNVSAPSLKDPVCMMLADSDVLHVGNWRDDIDKNGMFVTCFFTLCGLRSTAMSLTWDELSSVHNYDNLCGRCRNILGNRTKVIGGIEYGQLFSLTKFPLFTRLGRMLPQMRLDNIELSFIVSSASIAWRVDLGHKTASGLFSKGVISFLRRTMGLTIDKKEGLEEVVARDYKYTFGRSVVHWSSLELLGKTHEEAIALGMSRLMVDCIVHDVSKC